MHNVIIGVDPGSNITGYGIIKLERKFFSLLDYGIIDTSDEKFCPKSL